MNLSWLRQRPEKSEKMSSIADMFSAASVTISSRNIVSAAYLRKRDPLLTADHLKTPQESSTEKLLDANGQNINR